MVSVRVTGMTALSSSLHRISRCKLQGRVRGEHCRNFIHLHRDRAAGMQGNKMMLGGNSTKNLLKLALLVKQGEYDDSM